MHSTTHNNLNRSNVNKPFPKESCSKRNILWEESKNERNKGDKTNREGKTTNLVFKLRVQRNHLSNKELCKAQETCQGNPFKGNTKIHPIQNKWEFTLCCVHNNTNTVACVHVLSILFLWSVFFPFIVVRRLRTQHKLVEMKVPSRFSKFVVFILVYVEWCNPNVNTTPVIFSRVQYFDAPRGHFILWRDMSPMMVHQS